MYRYVGTDSQSAGSGGDELRDSEGAEEWEVMTPTAVAWKSPVTVLSWGPGRGLFGCGGSMGSSVMREDVLHRGESPLTLFFTSQVL